jgi:hypothetical protein
MSGGCLAFPRLFILIHQMGVHLNTFDSMGFDPHYKKMIFAQHKDVQHLHNKTHWWNLCMWVHQMYTQYIWQHGTHITKKKKKNWFLHNIKVHNKIYWRDSCMWVSYIPTNVSCTNIMHLYVTHSHITCVMWISYCQNALDIHLICIQITYLTNVFGIKVVEFSKYLSQ